MGDIFDPNGPGSNLMNFGFSTMAAAATPGIPTLSAIGAGGQGMNAAALQQAQMQNIRQEAESKRLQNQLIPFQMNLLQNQSKLIGSLADDDTETSKTPPSVGTGQQWQPNAGMSLPTKQATREQPNGNVSQKPINNPGNLRPVGSSSGFMAYPTPQDGLSALKDDLMAKINGSHSMQGKPPTLRNVISVYAPAKENNTADYIKNVSLGSGIDPDKELTADDVDKIIPFIVKQEGNSSALTPFQQRRQQIEQGSSAVAIPKPTRREMAMGFLGMPQLASEQYKAETAGPVTAAQEAAKTAEAGPKKAAEDTGTNKAAAEKTLNVMTSNLPIAIKRFQELRDVAGNTSFGVGVEGKDNEPGWKQTLAYQLAPYNKASQTTAKANTVFQQKTAQGVLPELGPSLAQAGIKGNKFLETLANEASGLNMAADPESKLSGIQGLEDQYVRNLKSTAQQVRSFGGDAPTDEEIDKIVAQMKGPSRPSTTQDLSKYKNPKMIGLAYKKGEITKEQARKLLQENHGLQ